MQTGQTGRELQWSQSLLFTPKVGESKTAVPDYMSPKPSRSPSTGYRTGTRERSMSPGSFRRRSLTPSGSYRETPPPPPADSLLDSPIGALPMAYSLEASRQDAAAAAGPSTSAAPGPPAAWSAYGMQAAPVQEAVDGWITVFGFAPGQLELVLQEFSKCGDILQFGTFGQGATANWVHIQYENKYAAQRALQRSGMRLTPSLMVGVKLLDDASRMAIEQYMGISDGAVATGAGAGAGGAAFENGVGNGGASMRPKVMQVRPYSLTRQPVPMPMPARTTWSKINEFVFGL